MNIKLKQIKKVETDQNIVILTNKDADLSKILNNQEQNYLKRKVEQEEKTVLINRYDNYLFIELLDEEEEAFKLNEKLRKAAHKVCKTLNNNKSTKVVLQAIDVDSKNLLPYAEGLVLSNYQFIKYFKDAEKKKNTLKEIGVFSADINNKELDRIIIEAEAIHFAKDMINEPVMYLTAEKLAEEIRKKQKEAGYTLTVMNKKEIEKEKMGGLLAVNLGSINPPTFSILEWKPEKPKNKKPLVLVGKGVVYDTGGLSLKPTSSMDTMKSDMSGAAAVAGIMYAVSKAKLPVHVIGLIPATDNRPDGNAYTPGDVIKMHDGSTVEVLNTDAEGRMLLADALSYAKKYKPELVVDMATLTGAAAYAIGKYGIVAMGNADEKTMNKLKDCGKRTYERLVEFPFWEEYKELLKSDIADLKNVGGRVGGAITAGKFLEHFTDYPYVHLDIAGPAFVSSEDSYRGKGATGAGIRLMLEFIEKLK